MYSKSNSKEQHQEEGRVRELPGGALSVPSFTNPNVRYKTHPESGYCACPAYAYTGKPCKHVALGEAIQNAHALRFGKAIAEDRVMDLCYRIFSPLDDNYIGSYLLAVATEGYRHATPRMKFGAWRRHRRTLAMADAASRRAA